MASLAPGKRKGLDTFPLRQGAMAGAIKLCDAHGKPLGGWIHGKDGNLTRERLSWHVFVYGRSLFDLDEHLVRELSVDVARLAKRGEEDETARRAGDGLWSWLGDMDGPGLQRVEIVEREGRLSTMFHRAGVALPLAELPGGYRAMLTVVIDLVMRYCQSFPSLEERRARSGGTSTIVRRDPEADLPENRTET